MKETIIDRALLMFRKSGIRNVTMDRVAAEIGISKRTLYEYFPSKDALVEACLIHELERRKVMAAEILSSSQHIIEIYILFMWNYVSELRKTHHLFMQDIRRLYPGTLCKQASEFEMHIKQKVTAFVLQGQREGFFRPDVDPDLAAIVLFQQIQMLTENGDTIFPPEKYPPYKVFAHIAIHFIRGLATLEGLKIIDHFYALHALEMK